MVVIHTCFTCWISRIRVFFFFFQAFSSIQTKQDTNSRELLAIPYGLKSFRSFIQSKTVKVYTDNVNGHIIADKGSTSLRLHDLALQFFQFCVSKLLGFQDRWLSLPIPSAGLAIMTTAVFLANFSTMLVQFSDLSHSTALPFWTRSSVLDFTLNFGVQFRKVWMRLAQAGQAKTIGSFRRCI